MAQSIQGGLTHEDTFTAKQLQENEGGEKLSPIPRVNSFPTGKNEQKPDVEKALKATATNEDEVVCWDGPCDPANPLNWPSRKKWIIIAMISTITFNQGMSSTIFAPGLPQIMNDFGSSDAVLGTLLISSFVIGLAVGPLFLSPLSELYGRVPLIHATNLMFLVSTTICAVSPNIPLLVVFRLVMGVSMVPLGGGYVADLMDEENRARAMNVWTIGPVLAPVVGPIAGGYLSTATSWRWTFGLVGFLGVVIAITCFFYLPETYGPRLLELKARRLRKTTGNPLLRSKYDKNLKPSYLLRNSLARSTKMIVFCPIVGVVSIFLAIPYSYVYVMFTTFGDVFTTTYGFNSGEVGLAYLGIGIGSLVGQLAVDVLLRRHRKSQIKKNGKAEPEDQLQPLLMAGIFLSVGFFWYGWSLQYRVHWIVPIIGTSLTGVASSFCFLAVQTFLIEAFTIHAASALAANTFIRCAFGMTIPLAAPPLYRTLGLGWGNSLLGFLALTITPASWCLLKNGAALRRNPRFMPDL